MNVLISGASGLVGKDLIDPLLKKKHKIFAIYRNQNKRRIKLHHKNLFWKRIDLKNQINLKKKIDIIIHCAVVHDFSKKNKINEYINSNILSLANLIDFGIKSKTKMIINFSSMAVYGKIKVKHLNEDYSPISQNLLGLTKHLSEDFLFMQPINFINLRFPGILCSDKKNPRPWLQTLINKIKDKQGIKVHNANNYFNNVIDTKEIVRFILLIIKKKKKIRNTFNLSASKPLKLNKIIKIIKTKYQSKSKIKNVSDKSTSFIISIDKIKNKINFHPSSTEKIIERNL